MTPTPQEIEAVMKAFLEAPGFYGVITHEQRAEAVMAVLTPIIETAMLRSIKLACVQKSHGPCVCGFVDQIARERGLDMGGEE